MPSYPVFLGGDHAAFEREHANTPPEQRPDWPLPSFDAMDWAKAFVARHGGDVELMHVWFANALMRGYDEHAARAALAKARGQEPAHGDVGSAGAQGETA